MTDAHKVLGVGRDADVAEIRRRYLELVRQHSPEREPERFAAIRAAYDQLRDPAVHLKSRLFSLEAGQTLDELAARTRPDLRKQRIPTATLLSLGKP